MENIRLRKVIAALAVVSVALFGLTACGTSDDDEGGSGGNGGNNVAASGEGIVVGVAAPLSGISGEEGQRIRNGIEIAADELNAEGGIDGAPIELDVQDDEGAPDTAAGLVGRFTQDGAVAILGPYNSPNVLAMSAPIRQAEIPQLVMGVSQSIVEDANPWQFQTSPTDAQQIAGIVEALKDGGFKSPALLTDTSPLGAGAKEPIEDVLAEAKIPVVASETMEADATDVSPQLLKIKEANADVIVAWTVGAGYATIMQGLRQIGYEVPVMGNAATADTAVTDLAGSAADGLYFQDGLNEDKAATADFTSTWEEKHPDEVVSFTAALGYDALMAVAAGVQEVGPDPAALRDFLEGYSTTDQVSGAEGATFGWTPKDHIALNTEDLVWKAYTEGELAVADELPTAGE